MGSRLLWRRSATAAGIYASFLLGVLGTILAARRLGPHDFGRLAIVIAAVSFLQTLMDLTVEEAVVKYGFRYQAQGDWGRFRRLLSQALAYKGIGALLAAAILAALAPFADSIFGSRGLETPFLIGAIIPVAQAPEGMAASVLFLRRRYDVRSAFLTVSMALRLAAYVIGSRYGVTETVLGIAAAQIAATAAVSVAGLAAFRRFPRAEAVPLGSDRRPILSFILQSSVATSVVSFRPTLTPILLGLVSNTTEVGYFRAAQAPQQAVAALSAPARMVLLTEQTHDWEHGRQERVLLGVRRYTWVGAALAIVALPPLLVYMPELIRIVYTEKFVPAADAARVVLGAAAVQLVFGWTKSFPVTIGKPNLRIVTHGLETAVLLPLVLVLGSRWGAAGAAGGVLASTVAFAALWSFLFLRISREERSRAIGPATQTVGG